MADPTRVFLEKLDWLADLLNGNLGVWILTDCLSE